jgi:hypothetical protein
MERFIAIDNVCAWPNLTSMPDGSIVATIFNQPTHGGWEGDVDCWGSEDEGRTWNYRGRPAPHEPGTNRMNVAAGLAGDGAIIVIASGWSRRPPPGEYANPHDGEVLQPWVCRSEDGGRTWERVGSVAPLPGQARPLIPFGDIVCQDDGTLGVCCYSRLPPDEHAATFYASSDGGRTWEPRGTIAEVSTNETTPVVLPDARLLAAGRTLGDQHLELFVSDDRGVTWQTQGPLTLGRQHPAHLLLLSDNRLLLTYGIRNKGLYGIGARISPDYGGTWLPPQLLVDLPGATDGGYPSSVQAEDGTVVTAYYCNRILSHQRYHMGVVRWRVDL